MNVHQRVRLAELLSEAAELEHGLMCQYLYAAFSLKREPEEGVTWAQLELMRRWEASIMLVARQEMEHLGLVNNMLTAIGEAPYFVRPNFPLGPRHYQIDIPFKLERLTLDAVGRFIEFEMPRRPDPGSEARMEATVPAVKPGRFQTIGELYEEVVSLFEQLDSPELWIGPPGAQFITTEVIPVPIRGVSLAGKAIYDINLVAVTDLASAKQAIAQILEEGEGIPIPTPTSHFARFLTIAEELATAQHEDPSFDPARPVVENPRGRITSPATREVAELFELAYGTTILMLMRYFAHTDETQAQLAALQQTAFFPLMTTAIRPLGEVLTLLPARADAPTPTAGPTFDFTRNLTFHPHRRAAWHVMLLQLQQLAADALRLSTEPVYPEPVRERLELVYENAARMALNFSGAMGIPVPT
ncbi:MAG TPA: ferritin-like domain-containing protein [Gaiellaceae bacterium]|nr:ferritin-like domain-containing protein [Gaiellaceae bacterium]